MKAGNCSERSLDVQVVRGQQKGLDDDQARHSSAKPQPPARQLPQPSDQDEDQGQKENDRSVHVRVPPKERRGIENAKPCKQELDDDRSSEDVRPDSESLLITHGHGVR